MGRAECNLLGLSKIVFGVAVEHHAADHAKREDLLRDQLCRIKHVEVEGLRECLVEQLHTELPFGEAACVDGVPQVTAVEVRVAAADLQRLVQTTDCSPSFGRQWNFT